VYARVVLLKIATAREQLIHLLEEGHQAFIPGDLS